MNASIIIVSSVAVLGVGAAVYFLVLKPTPAESLNNANGNNTQNNNDLVPTPLSMNIYRECQDEARAKFPNDAAKRVDYYNTCKAGVLQIQLDIQKTRGQ